MDENIKETGLTIKCMAKASLHGLKEKNMKEIIFKTKNKVKENFITEMDLIMMGNGIRVDSMEGVNLRINLENNIKADTKTDNLNNEC